MSLAGFHLTGPSILTEKKRRENSERLAERARIKKAVRVFLVSNCLHFRAAVKRDND